MNEANRQYTQDAATNAGDYHAMRVSQWLSKHPRADQATLRLIEALLDAVADAKGGE